MGNRPYLGGGFQIFFIFTPTWGNDPILTHIFQRGWNHQLVEMAMEKSTCSHRKIDLTITNMEFQVWKNLENSTILDVGFFGKPIVAVLYVEFPVKKHKNEWQFKMEQESKQNISIRCLDLFTKQIWSIWLQN